MLKVATLTNLINKRWTSSLATKKELQWMSSLEKGNILIPYPGSVPPFQGTFHPMWLRDHCLCPKCIHPDNKQKLHSSGQIAKLPKESVTIAQHKISATSLEIQWNDGHSSAYPLSWLEKRDYGRTARAKRQAEKAPKLWTNNDLPINELRFDYLELEREPIFLKFLQALGDYGLVFVNNMPTTPVNQVETLAKRLGVIKETFYGISWDVKSLPGSKNIAYTDLYLGLHMDLMYLDAAPGVQFLHCIMNDTPGGDSLFLDIYKAVQLLETLDPDAYKLLTQVPVTFHYDNDDHHLQLRRPVISIDGFNEGDPYKISYSPPFQGPIDCIDPELVKPFYEAISSFEDIMQNPANNLLYQTRLMPGTCVLFNNRRVLHGRTSFDSSVGVRHLRGTYVDWDVFRDRLRSLEDKSANNST